MIRHVVMWKVKGESSDDRASNSAIVKRKFEDLHGKIPGMRHIEVGLNFNAVDYACDAVLFSEFESEADLHAYATHPEHLRVRDELAGIRVSRHQVDYIGPIAGNTADEASAAQL